MANYFFNQGKGRIAELANRVNNNDPAGAVFIAAVLNSITTNTQSALEDLDTFAAVLATTTTAEVTNTNYSRVVWTSTSGVTVTVDDTNDRVNIDGPDLTFTSISTGDNWSGTMIGYATSSTATDANITPLVHLKSVVTTDGNNISLQVGASGFARSS